MACVSSSVTICTFWLLAAGLPARGFGLAIVEFLSPVPEVHYLTRDVRFDVHLSMNDPAEGFRYCSRLHEAAAMAGDAPRPHAAVCNRLDNVTAELPAYSPAALTAGRHTAEFWLPNNAAGAEATADPFARATIGFFTGFAALEAALAAAAEAAAAAIAQDGGPATVVLGLKFGTHGDEAVASVAFDGVTVLRVGLDLLFDVAAEVRRGRLDPATKMVSRPVGVL